MHAVFIVLLYINQPFQVFFPPEHFRQVLHTVVAISQPQCVPVVALVKAEPTCVPASDDDCDWQRC